MTDNEMIWETADVKPCPHGYVFYSMCHECRWLKVTDRLPEIPEGRGFIDLLVTSYSPMRDLQHVGVAYFRDGKFFECGSDDEPIVDGCYWELTHWAYLPSPPKRVEGK